MGGPTGGCGLAETCVSLHRHTETTPGAPTASRGDSTRPGRRAQPHASQRPPWRRGRRLESPAGRAWAPAEAHGRAPGLHKAEKHEVCEPRIFSFSFFWNRAVIITFNQNESHTKKGGNIDNDTTDPSGTDRHGQTDSPQSCARSPGQDVAACLTP